jgi:O-antigen/teichoic acid export membrane protein
MERPTGFYSSLGLLVVLNAVIKPVWIFAIDRQVQNVTGTEDYGIYFSLLSLSIVLSFLSDWGFTSFFNQRLAAREKDFSDLPGQFFFLKIILSIVYCAVLFAVALASGIQRWDILVYTALIQVFTSFFIFFRAIITAHQWFRTDAWLSIADKTFMIITCGILLYAPSWMGYMTIKKFLFLQSLFLALSALTAFLYLFKKGIHFFIHRPLLPDREKFVQAFPFVLFAVFTAAHTRLDAFLLERIHRQGAYEAGVYAAAYRLLDAGNMAGYLISSFMLPYIARRWSEKKQVNSIVLQYRHILLMLSALAIPVFIFLSHWIVQMLYHHNNEYASEVLQWCMPAIAGYSLVYVYGTVLVATGRVLDCCGIIFSGALINVALNLVLIPSMGAKGCCIAALCSQLLTGAMLMVYSCRQTGLVYHARSFCVYIFAAAIISVFLYISNDLTINKLLLIGVDCLLVGMIGITGKLFGQLRLFTGMKNPL